MNWKKEDISLTVKMRLLSSLSPKNFKWPFYCVHFNGQRLEQNQRCWTDVQRFKRQHCFFTRFKNIKKKNKSTLMMTIKCMIQWTTTAILIVFIVSPKLVITLCSKLTFSTYICFQKYLFSDTFITF